MCSQILLCLNAMNYIFPPFFLQLQSPDLDISDTNHGLMVRTFNHLFEKIRALNNNDEICKIKASYLEIYNEKAIDLLNQGSKRLNLPLRWNKQNQAFTVENLFVFSCSETQDLVNILVEGKILFKSIVFEI